MQGVLYLLSNPRMSELLTMSLYSLRRYYDGPLTLAVTRDSRQMATRIAADERLAIDLKLIRSFGNHSRHDSRHTKLLAWMATPYGRTVYIDADTAIQGSIDPLLECTGFGLTDAGLGGICDGDHQAKRLWGEVVNYQRFSPGGFQFCADVQNANLPATNTGVVSFAWPKHQMIIERAHDLVCLARATHRRVSDETVIQLLMPRIDDLRIFPPTYNRTFAMEHNWREQILCHFAAKAWYNSRRGRSCARWHMAQAWNHNAGGIRRWAGQGEPHIGRILPRKKTAGGEG